MTDISRLCFNATVKWFDADKAFGFLVPADGGKDIFLHLSTIVASGFSSEDFVPGVAVSAAYGPVKKGVAASKIHALAVVKLPAAETTVTPPPVVSTESLLVDDSPSLLVPTPETTTVPEAPAAVSAANPKRCVVRKRKEQPEARTVEPVMEVKRLPSTALAGQLMGVGLVRLKGDKTVH